MQLDLDGPSFVLSHRGAPVLSHRPGRPFLFVGKGLATIAMHRGNFDIEDRLTARLPLTHVAARPAPDGWRLLCGMGGAPLIEIAVELRERAAVLRFSGAAPCINRVWLRLHAEADEAVWGGGEQMSYFDLRGRRFPIWTSEPGVGRDRTSPITFQADAAGRAGGDYWTTNYPQPTFLSSRGLAAHLQTTAWAALDFRDPGFHELEAWAVPDRLELDAGTPAELVGRFGTRFGASRPAPGWTGQGVVLGLKRGQAHAANKLDAARRAGIPVAALWCEDWAGVRETGFGTRLFWDWRWNRERYPTLDTWIPELLDEGVRFMGYVNPYLCDDGLLFPEADRRGLFAQAEAGGTARIDFGEFRCGTLDLTLPEAGEWFTGRVLRPMLDLGMAGWMADFGEYLPTDVRLAAGDPTLEHNAWPVRWAALNAQAIAGQRDVTFFMRAGHTGLGRHCPLLWAGDQCVDFSRHDGLVTAVTAALSSGLVGNRQHHGDIGGYTSLFGLRRMPELFMRWAELATFTSLMRTHEGNRPGDNFQWWEDDGAAAHLASMARRFVALAPLRAALLAREDGLPLQRPLVLHHPHDPATWAANWYRIRAELADADHAFNRWKAGENGCA